MELEFIQRGVTEDYRRTAALTLYPFRVSVSNVRVLLPGRLNCYLGIFEIPIPRADSTVNLKNKNKNTITYYLYIVFLYTAH